MFLQIEQRSKADQIVDDGGRRCRQIVREWRVWNTPSDGRLVCTRARAGVDSLAIYCLIVGEIHCHVGIHLRLRSGLVSELYRRTRQVLYVGTERFCRPVLPPTMHDTTLRLSSARTYGSRRLVFQGRDARRPCCQPTRLPVYTR